MTTLDNNFYKALGMIAPGSVELLMKTEPDVDKVLAVLPKIDQEVMAELKDYDQFEPALVYAIKKIVDKQKETRNFCAGWSAAQERAKAAKKIVDKINFAQTVGAHGEQLAEHETFVSEQKTFNAEQKTFKEEQTTTNKFVKKELDARKQDKNDLKIRMRNVEGDVREQKGKEAIVERVLTFNKETKEEELQRSLSPCGNQIHGAYHFTAPAC